MWDSRIGRNANATVHRLADEMYGVPYRSIGEIFDIPMTAHFLGGEYRRLEPIPPQCPAVPANAPAALRLSGGRVSGDVTC